MGQRRCRSQSARSICCSHGMKAPSISTIILKVAAPCNLNCSYCYEYNRGDDSWKLKPGSISTERCELIGSRVRDYCLENGLKEFGINLHGGEPMLLGPRRIAEAIDVLRTSAAPVLLRFGMQSNATLASEEMVEVLRQRHVNVGVSLDGDEFSNRFRVDHKGRPTREATVNGIRLLRQAGIFAGLQAVIDLQSDPVSVINALAGLDAPMLELTIPFGNHDNPPQSHDSQQDLGDWLCKAFDHWVGTPSLARLRIRLLQDAVEAVLSEQPASEWFPSAPPGYLVVATDGAYEGLDTLKVVGSEGRVLHMNISEASISQALDHPSIQMRNGPQQLCDECRDCAIVRWCNGGYFPTRFGKGNGFKNPSVYCDDLKVFLSHVARWILSQRDTPDTIRQRINQRLDLLDRNPATAARSTLRHLSGLTA
jgi:sulfatase maturation enzyme AslB (radical SAM superfamily)